MSLTFNWITGITLHNDDVGDVSLQCCTIDKTMVVLMLLSEITVIHDGYTHTKGTTYLLFRDSCCQREQELSR